MSAEMTRELLESVIGLTHPDRHPPERAAKAGRVTQELLALRPYVRPEADREACDVELPITITGRRRTSTGLVVASPAFLLKLRVDEVMEGATIVLFDADGERNESTGEIRPVAGTRWLGIHHRAGIYARIRGQISVTFFFIR